MNEYAYKTMAHINSLKGEMDEITVVEALFNWFVCQFYADDIYRIVKEDENNG